MPKPTQLPSEHDEAVTLKQYLDILMIQKRIVCYSHIPQETFTKNWGTKMKNKAEGVHSGVPDYIIVTPHKILFLELKRRKGLHVNVTLQQKFWIQALNGVDSHISAAICRGFDEAKEFIEDNVL